MELTSKYLREANLEGVNLEGVNLTWANLEGANLKRSTLKQANLIRANLEGANLREANLEGVNLTWADLSGADLTGANLYGANLREANLREANLEGANLEEANLEGANLREANLERAVLKEVKNMPFIPFACPAEGSFIGYKKAFDYAGKKSYIVKLHILDDSKRSSATTSKCRCDKAKVLGIENIDGTAAEVSFVNSWHDIYFGYEVGKIVQADNYDENRWNECSGGIHFFVNRDEAVDYVI